jgi:hypothetical protein
VADSHDYADIFPRDRFPTKEERQTFAKSLIQLAARIAKDDQIVLPVRDAHVSNTYTYYPPYIDGGYPHQQRKSQEMTITITWGLS